MEYNRALVVTNGGDSPVDGLPTTLSEALVECGLAPQIWDEARITQAAQTSEAVSFEPVLIVLMPDLANQIVVGRLARTVWTASHLLFAQHQHSVDQLRKALSHAPMLGYHWSLAELEDEKLAAQISNAVDATRRRTQLRTTLDKVNAGLATRQRRADETRRSMSEHYLANFLAQASESILAADGKGQILYWNSSAQSLLRMNDEEMVKLDIHALPFWSPQLASAIEAANDGPGRATCEVIFDQGDVEAVLEIGCSPVRDRSGELIGTTLVIRDVSDRHRSLEAEREEHRIVEEALIKERARILGLFNLAPGFLAVFQGAVHVFELANEAFTRLFGRRQLAGLPIRTAFPQLQNQEFITLLDHVYATGDPFVGRFVPVRLGAQDGLDKMVYIDFVFQPITDATGRPIGIFVQGSDVTAHKSAQDALMTHQAELEQIVNDRTASLRSAEQALLQSQKLESLGKLTGGVAHDFNNILQVIGGNLELLKDQVHSLPAARARIDTASSAVVRGSKLASQLLAFARKQPLQPLPTNVARVVREMDDMLRRALGESIQIETILGGGLWTALVDRNQLENVILNLAINARDAMDGHGSLTIELGNAMLDDHYVQENRDATPGQYVMLAVSDTGRGMPPEVLARAFEPFYTTKPEGEGTGLGLSMAYGFVKQSAGHIKIYSEPGSGTTIKVYLPRVMQDEVALDDIRRMPAVGGAETILVVEDDAAVRNTVVDILADLGYTVLKATDGQGGLVILQSGIPVDLLFTDVVMPGPVRSTELARHAKELHPQIEVLFTSGYTQNAIVHGGRLDAGVELISKPYRREDLAKKIRSLLARRRPNETSTHQPASVPAGDVRPQLVTRSLLVVEDDDDARQILCDLLSILGYAPVSVGSGKVALATLQEQSFDILITDQGLPDIPGLELARRAVQMYGQLQVIFISGYGQIDAGDLPSRSLPKPYTLKDLQSILESI